MIKYDLPAIKREMVQHFNLHELKDAYFDLYVDWEDVIGTDTISDKSRELLTFLDRRLRMPELIVYLQRKRPNVKWNLVRTQKEQSDDFAHEIGLNPAISSKYLDAKFESHMGVWQSLENVKEAGNALWESASRENILNFAALIRQTRSLVSINAILFEREDYDDLLLILDEFSNFSAGKTRLIQIKSEFDEMRFVKDVKEALWKIEQIEHQIRTNSEIKGKYEAILEKICVSFRHKLNALVSH